MNTTICVLGRQPEIGLAELEALYGSKAVSKLLDSCAVVEHGGVDVNRLGGSQKIARYLTTLPTGEPSKIFSACTAIVKDVAASMPAGKIKLGVSLYGVHMPVRTLGGHALHLKKALKNAGYSVRMVPNTDLTLSSAQSYHNGLASPMGLELLVVVDGQKTLIGHVQQVQHIDAYRVRDRERPKRDAFVGMLPPKLAQVIVNLALGQSGTDTVVYDPFCGTGVILQEALLIGHDVMGSDVSQKMVDFTAQNLQWLAQHPRWQLSGVVRSLVAANATHLTLQKAPANLCIASETFLGQPLGGQSPTQEKLSEIVHDTNHLIKSFIKNLHGQLAPGTRLCLALPAWFVGGTLHRLPVLEELAGLGFDQHSFVNAAGPLIYHRDAQVTGRELVVLTAR